MKKTKYLSILLLMSGGVYAESDYDAQVTEAEMMSEVDATEQVFELNDFSQQFVGQNPEGVSEARWKEYLYQLQMLTDMAMQTSPSTEQEREAMLAQLGTNAINQANLCIQSLPALDVQVDQAAKEAILNVQAEYVRSVVNAVVAELVETGKSQEVVDMINDFEAEAQAAQSDMSEGEMEVSSDDQSYNQDYAQINDMQGNNDEQVNQEDAIDSGYVSDDSAYDAQAFGDGASSDESSDYTNEYYE